MVRWPGVDPEQPAHGRGRGRRQQGEGAHLHHVAVARHARAPGWSRPTSTPGRRWSSCSRRRRRSSSTPSPACPTTTPSSRAAAPAEGARSSARSIPFDELGEWADRVTPSPYFADPHITMSETPLGKAVPEPPSPEEHERRELRNERGCGQALAGRLLRACLDRGIEPRTSCAGRELILEDGAVVGVLVDTPDGPIEVRANEGRGARLGRLRVERASCGRAFLRGPMTHPVSIETQHRRRAAHGDEGRGDALQHARGVVDPRRRRCPWTYNPLGRILVNGQRTLPHSIMVNRRGRRFTNEAANYNAFGAAFHVEDVSRFEYANLPCWLVFDQNYVETYGFRVSAGAPEAARCPTWVPRGDTPAELADGARHRRRRARADRSSAGTGSAPRATTPTSVAATAPSTAGGATRTARAGATRRSGRSSAGPFYAYEIHSGALGTKGGPRVDPDARVLDLDGEPIPGLYAAGNVMGSPVRDDLRRARAAPSARPWCSATSPDATPRPADPRRPAPGCPGRTSPSSAEQALAPVAELDRPDRRPRALVYRLNAAGQRQRVLG